MGFIQESDRLQRKVVAELYNGKELWELDQDTRDQIVTNQLPYVVESVKATVRAEFVENHDYKMKSVCAPVSNDLCLLEGNHAAAAEILSALQKYEPSTKSVQITRQVSSQAMEVHVTFKPALS
jgi:hypothetical protein